MLDRFTVSLDVGIRTCRDDDLPTLEWFGMYGAEHDFFREMYERHLRGEMVMLIAQANGVASGQAWIDLPSADEPSAYIWSVRVFPALQRLGIGTRLIKAAEQIIQRRGATMAAISAERDNSRALRFYQRLGYAVDPQATRIGVHSLEHQLLMRKRLNGHSITHGVNSNV